MLLVRILLDEVNLASPETLECVSSLLHSPTASITLTSPPMSAIAAAPYPASVDRRYTDYDAATFPFYAQPSLNAVTAASSPTTASAPLRSRIFTLPPGPSRAHSHKIHRKRGWHDHGDNDSEGSGTETQQDPGSLRAAYQRAFRRASERALTMPSARTSKKSEPFRTVSPVTARRAVSRRLYALSWER